MLKVKHERDCDCVVAGFRWHKKGEGTAVGSLLLGLYDDTGALQHVGVCASFTDKERRELVEFLAPYRKTRSRIIPGKHWADTVTDAKPGIGCPAARAAGARARIFMGAVAARAGRGSRLRTYARQPFPSYGAVSQMAHRQKAERLHLCAARSGSAAGARGDIR